MRQLDKFVFFRDIFWFLLLISIFYYYFINYFITNLSSLLKLKIKYLTSLKLDLVNQTKKLLYVQSLQNKNFIILLLCKLNIMIHINKMLGFYKSKFLIEIKKFSKIPIKANEYEVITILSAIYPSKRFLKNIYIFYYSYGCFI